MKISYKTDYALKTLLELGLKYNKYNRGVISIQELAKKGDIPEKFLEQVLLLLKKGGFVNSKRGVNGGYFLAKPPETITIGSVIRFVEGPIEPIACVGKEHYGNCKDFKDCIFRDVWKDIYKSISYFIDTITLGELVRKVEQKAERREYTYCI